MKINKLLASALLAITYFTAASTTMAAEPGKAMAHSDLEINVITEEMRAELGKVAFAELEDNLIQPDIELLAKDNQQPTDIQTQHLTSR